MKVTKEFGRARTADLARRLRAWRVINADRRSLYYCSTRDDDAEIREKRRELANQLHRLSYRRMGRARRSPQPLCVPGHVLGHEGRDEVIGVVVTLLHPDCRREAGGFARSNEQRGAELFGQKIISAALVNQ